MREYTLISSLGLAGNQLMSLASMLKLAAELRDRFRLGDPDDASADVMLVNADDPAAVSTLEEYRQANQSLTPIMLTSDADSFADEITLVRPLVIRRVISALKEATESPSRLAQKEPTEDAEAAAEAEEAAVVSAVTKILVVDDSFPVRKYMEQKIPLLSKTQVDLHFAASGEEAITMVKEGAPDLIFLDVMMPGVDGYKVCKWIKSIRPTAHVAMLTSKKSPFDKVRGAMSGCNDYLTKPPEDKKLAKILEAK